MEYLRFSCPCSPEGLLWCHDLYLNLLSTFNPNPLCLWPWVLYTCSLMTLPFHCPVISLPPLFWLLSLCSLFLCLWLYFARFFILLIRFHLEVRSYGICPSQPGLFHLAQCSPVPSMLLQRVYAPSFSLHSAHQQTSGSKNYDIFTQWVISIVQLVICLLYTSDAADDLSVV